MDSNNTHSLEAFFSLNIYHFSVLVLSLVLAMLCSLHDLKFADQGLNPGPRTQKHHVLTTEPPGNSLVSPLFFVEQML